MHDMHLQGHLSSVSTVLVNDRDNQIISLGADKQIKVGWCRGEAWESCHCCRACDALCGKSMRTQAHKCT